MIISVFKEIDRQVMLGLEESQKLNMAGVWLLKKDFTYLKSEMADYFQKYPGKDQVITN